jgi:hypothetical protein
MFFRNHLEFCCYDIFYIVLSISGSPNFSSHLSVRPSCDGNPGFPNPSDNIKYTGEAPTTGYEPITQGTTINCYFNTFYKLPYRYIPSFRYKNAEVVILLCHTRDTCMDLDEDAVQICAASRPHYH